MPAPNEQQKQYVKALTAPQIVITNNTGNVVGAVQQLNPQTTRNLYRVRGVGFDHTLEIVPGTVDYTLGVNRIIWNRKRISQAMGLSFQEIHSQQFPFDIQIKQYFNQSLGTSTKGQGNQITKSVSLITFKYCFFQSNNWQVSPEGNLVITENATVWPTFVVMDTEATGSSEEEADRSGWGPRDFEITGGARTDFNTDEDLPIGTPSR